MKISSVSLLSILLALIACVKADANYDRRKLGSSDRKKRWYRTRSRPTHAPTVSHAPSVSKSPTDYPTVSPAPSVSSEPSSLSEDEDDYDDSEDEGSED